MKKFPPGVEFSIKVEPEDLPVRGNALASGNEEEDKKVEDEIIRRLDDGDIWAWGFVTVAARYAGFEGTDGLGGCSYKDEDDFKQDGGYFEDIKWGAYNDLKTSLEFAIRQGKRAAQIVKDLEKEEGKK